MGAFAVNLHVRLADAAAVRRQLEACGAAEFRVTEPLRGWVSVYERCISDQDEARIKDLAAKLSGGLEAACVAFLLHDSDIACYWLYNDGQLLDEFNSAPDYFEAVSAEERRRVQGRADVYARFCQPGVTVDQIESVLRTKVLFADDTVSQLAEFLGVGPERALSDFRRGGEGPEDRFDDDFEGENGGLTGPVPVALRDQMRQRQEQYQSMLASMSGPAPTPFGNEMVQAASAGHVAEIDRLLASGADANAVGSIAPAQGQELVTLCLVPPGIRLSALVAAALHGRVEVVRRLIAAGAKLQDVHPLCGTPLHAAVRAGSPEIIQMLLAAGVSPDTRNAQGQSPLAFLQSLRQVIESAKTALQHLPPQLRAAVNERLANAPELEMPASGWDACETLLRQAGARS
jgi:hypothetical protein